MTAAPPIDLIEAGEVETHIEAAVAKGLTKFVGREKEIAALKEAFAKTRSGSGQREKALETLKKAEGAFREMGMDYGLRRTQEVLEVTSP